MFLILPDSLDPGIQSMEANLTTDTIKALMTTLQVMEMYLFSSYFSPFRTKWWMWKCRVSKSKRPATLTKRSEASGWRRSSRQEWPTSPTWCAGTLSTSPSSATGGHFRPKTLDLRGYISGQRLRRKSGGGMASMLQTRNRKLESWSKNILRYIYVQSIDNCLKQSYNIFQVFVPSQSTSQHQYDQVDRAFLYFVWDYFTGTILFMGRVTRPLVLWGTNKLWRGTRIQDGKTL